MYFSFCRSSRTAGCDQRDSSMAAISAVEGTKRSRVSASVGGLASSGREVRAGAPAMVKPRVKVRRVRARAMGARMWRGRLGGGGCWEDWD